MSTSSPAGTNFRWADTLWQMEFVARRMFGKRLRYADLVATGLASGARS